VRILAGWDWLLVGVGGAVGAMVRYGVGRVVAARLGTAFPWGTLLINVSGAFLIGVLLTALARRGDSDDAWRLVLAVGFLGGYTTFSAFAYETVGLLERGDAARAALYVLGSNGLGLLACVAGIALARAIVP